jgi:gas vesicle protein
MNEEIKKKIEDLATNLKNMHLAASIEEARERAEEIILSTIKEGDKSIKELMEENQTKEKIMLEIEDLENKIEEKEKEIEELREEIKRKKNILEKKSEEYKENPN